MSAALPFGLSSENRLTWKAWLLLTFFALAVFLPGLWTLPPTDRDESRFAQASKQMIESGNYVDIRFRDEARNKKPVGIYWLQSAAVHLTGAKDQIGSYRLPSLFGALAAVLLTALIGVRLFSPAVGFAAGLILATCLILNVEARLAKTDAVLLACTLLAQYALATAYLGPFSTRIREYANAALFWIGMGVGFLVKGPIILLVAGGTLLALWRMDKGLGWAKRLHPLSGILLATLIAAPWFIAITLHTNGAFYQESVGHDLLGKIAKGQNWIGTPPGLYLALFPLTFWPWAFFALLALPACWRLRHVPPIRFCFAWIIPTWILFELFVTKLPHYVLPTYPAIAILTAYGLLNLSSALAPKRIWLRKTALSVCLFVGLLLTALFIAAPIWIEHRIDAAASLGLLLAAITLPLAIHLQRQGRIFRSILILSIGGAVLYTSVFAFVLPEMRRIWPSREIAAAVEKYKPCPYGQLVAIRHHEPSLVFLVGTDTLFADRGADAADRLVQDQCLLALVDDKETPAFQETLQTNGYIATEVWALDGFNPGRVEPTRLHLYKATQ
jgi:4-amino-4-deoxy-L-arabinose transferase-like glycosyltransferase